MSNGQPPFPPPGNLPPFRPNFAAGTLPPFPPKGHHGQPPPFPPKYPPGSPGVRPHGSYPLPSAHPGIGLPPLPTGLPNPPHSSANSHSAARSRQDVKTTKIFVGSIAPGIRDQTLKDLLNACGPLHELKRVEGAGGKPQAFGFASFESPEVVLRCIRCLNGVELPDLTPEGRQEGRPPKALVVKADQKTAAFLQEFEDTLGRSESDESADDVCRKAIAHIVARLTDANQKNDGRQGRGSGRLSPINVVVPAHLQDLKEGDLPESQRVAVLDQIAIFRENAARREREKKRIDEDKERFKVHQNANHAGYGYGGNRGFAKPEDGARRSSSSKGGSEDRKDPQSYSEPVSFVRPETAEGKSENERTDLEEEEIRQRRREKDRVMALRDRESRVESRERQRIDTALREQSVRHQRADAESRNRRATAELLDSWDDNDVEDRGKDLFYSDRAQWRLQRQHQRQREQEDDAEDRRQEATAIRALEAESDDFLKQQMVELASLEAKQPQVGLLTEDAAPIKLAIAADLVPEPKEEVAAQLPRRPAMALGDDEDESANQRRKRALVKLEYEQELDEAEELAKLSARLLDLGRQLPSSKHGVFSSDIDWELISNAQTTSKIQGFARQKIAQLLGEPDEDLANFVMEHVAGRKAPEDLVDELTPVLAEEADLFVVQLWRQIMFETQAAKAGLDTGSMVV